MASKRDVPCNSMNRNCRNDVAFLGWLDPARAVGRSGNTTPRLGASEAAHACEHFATELRYETKVQVMNTVSRPHWSNNAWTRVRRFGVRQRKC